MVARTGRYAVVVFADLHYPFSWLDVDDYYEPVSSCVALRCFEVRREVYAFWFAAFRSHHPLLGRVYVVRVLL